MNKQEIIDKQETVNKQQTVTKQQIIDKLKKIEKTIAEYDDVIREESSKARSEVEMVSEKALQETLKSIDDENRLLTIGIIGRVKAGKSSMLNSVFFEGKSVLPKAATPMTASLTEMIYAQSYSITVQYYTAEDIDKIKKNHDEYLKQVEEQTRHFCDEQKKNNEDVDKEKARRKAETQVQKNSILSASFEHYNLMKESGKIDEMRSKSDEKIEFKSPDELKDKLQKYVGHDGAMMPFTRNVIICMPEPSLKDICVVDTPGLNDPVVSRSRRTDEYLGKCDVVFIVSPAGQFLNEEDQKLMDRLSSKEGIRQLYCVASKSDNQLYGSIGEKAGWDLNKALSDMRFDLASQMGSVLKGLKGDRFDQLIDESQERLIIISAMCHDLDRRFEDKESWDGGMNVVWDNLKESYPENFESDNGAIHALKNISNVEKIGEKIEQMRSQKEEIIRTKQEDYLLQQNKTVDDFRKQLIKNIDGKIKLVEKADKEKLEEDEKKLKKDKAFFDEADEIFEESLGKFLEDQKGEIKKAGKTLADRADKEIRELVTVEEKVETQEKTIPVEIVEEVPALIEQRTPAPVDNDEGGFLDGVIGVAGVLLSRFVGGAAGALIHTGVEIVRSIFGSESDETEPQAETRTVTRIENRTETVYNSIRIESIRVGDVETILMKLKRDLAYLPEEIGFHQAMKAWRDQTYADIYKRIEGTDTSEVSITMLRKAFRNMINETKLPDINLNFSDFSYWQKGTLEEKSEIAELFVEVAKWLIQCNDFYKKSINEFIEKTKDVIKTKRYIWPDMDKQIKDLKESIKNKPQTTEKLGEAKRALEEI